LKLFQGLKIGILVLLSLIVGIAEVAHTDNGSGSSKVTITTDATDPLQVFFLVGVNELNRGNYPAAIDIFYTLAQKTDNPRVKLELARALFLDRRYRASKKVFQEVLKQSDIPWAVQENIRAYLEEIDSALGYVKFGLSLVSDSNPMNFTDSRQVMIAGQLLTIMPPEDTGEVYGVRFSVNAARALTDRGTLIGYLSTYYSHFEKVQFDRGVADIGLLYSFQAFPKFKIRAGIEESIYGGRHLYEFPYTGLIFTPYFSGQFGMNNELKVGWLRVPEAAHLNAANLSLTTKMNMNLSRGILGYVDLYLEKSMTDEKAYAYHGGLIGVGLDLPFFFKGWRLKPYASVGQRVYEAADPFFSSTRRDTTKKVSVTLKNWNIKILDYTPEIGITYEDNSSSLDYYSYDKIVLNFSIN